MTSRAATKVPLWSHSKRWLRRIALAFFALVGFYVLFLLLGFVPVNREYQPPAAADRVRILVRSNEIHTDIVMPVLHDELGIDWRELFPPQHFAADVTKCQFVSVGWGSRGFFIETPTWAEFKLSTAAGALFWPSESVLHVEYIAWVNPSDSMREVFVSRQQYQELAQFIRDSIEIASGGTVATPASEVTYGPGDRFYASRGRYHCFNTCNQWTGRGLARAGVPVGIWTPLKPQVLCWLPEPSQESE